MFHLFCPRWCHFEGPDCCWAHVHSCAEVSGDVPRLRGAEPVIFALVDHVIEAPGALVGFVFQALTHQESCITKSRSGPDLFCLIIRTENRAVSTHTVRRTHLAIAKLHHVKGKDLSHCGYLHLVWNDISKASQVGIPLARELIGLNSIFELTVGVISEVLAILYLGDVGLLAF